MSTELASTSRRLVRWLHLKGEDWLVLAGFAVLLVFGLMGAFTHMHDWTIDSIDAAIAEHARETGRQLRFTPDWFGWTNAVTSEITPTMALLLMRKRQRQNRSVVAAGALFVGALALSLLAQLSVTGVEVKYAAQILVCLPVLSLTVLMLFKLSDMSYAREHAEAAELAAAREREEAELAAELKARKAAELARADARQAAELAAELKRQEAAQAAELEARRLAAELDAAERRARIEAEAATKRAEIEARDRMERRAAEERVALREAEAQRLAAVEKARVEAEAAAELVRAQAAALEAEAEAKRQAAARLAALTAERSTAGSAGGSGASGTGRQRRPRAETAEAVQAVLALLPAGTERPAAVLAVAEQLDVTTRYAGEFVPTDFVAGGEVARSAASSVGADGEVPHRRHLALASSGLGSAS